MTLKNIAHLIETEFLGREIKVNKRVFPLAQAAILLLKVTDSDSIEMLDCSIELTKRALLHLEEEKFRKTNVLGSLLHLPRF